MLHYQLEILIGFGEVLDRCHHGSQVDIRMFVLIIRALSLSHMCRVLRTVAVMSNVDIDSEVDDCTLQLASCGVSQ